MNKIGQISVIKSLYLAILKKTGISLLMSEKMMLIISLIVFFWTWMDLLTSMPYLKKVRKYQLKLRIKPWITTAIHTSILVKNSLFRKYIKLKNPV